MEVGDRMSLSERVYEILRRVPRGKVTTYGDVARLIGAPRCARQVGWALHNNPAPVVNPCHRVVFKDGSICTGFAFGGPEEQARLLREEGVEIVDGKIDMKKYRWEV